MARLADGVAKRLLSTTDTTNKETESETQQHRGEDGAEDRSLDDVEVVLGQQDDEQHNLDHGAEARQDVSFALKCTRGMPDTHVISVNMPMTRGSFCASSCPAKPMRLAHGTMAMYASVKMRMCRSSMVSVRPRQCKSSTNVFANTSDRKRRETTHIAQPVPQAQTATEYCRVCWRDWTT